MGHSNTRDGLPNTANEDTNEMIQALLLRPPAAYRTKNAAAVVLVLCTDRYMIAKDHATRGAMCF